MDPNRLIEQYSALLSGYCLHLCQNTHDAQDLFQDTWERVLKESKKRKTPLSHEKAWLFRICTNLYIDRFRKQGRERCIEFADQEQKDAFLQNVPDPSRREDFSELYDALTRLSPPLKAVIVLKYFYGYRDSEISELLKIPEGTVRSRLHAGKLQLRSDLSDEASHR